MQETYVYSTSLRFSFIFERKIDAILVKIQINKFHWSLSHGVNEMVWTVTKRLALFFSKYWMNMRAREKCECNMSVNKQIKDTNESGRKSRRKTLNSLCFLEWNIMGLHGKNKGKGSNVSLSFKYRDKKMFYLVRNELKLCYFTRKEQAALFRLFFVFGDPNWV